MEFFKETIHPRDHFWIDQTDFNGVFNMTLKDGKETVCDITAIFDYQHTKKVLFDNTIISRGVISINDILYLVFEYAQYPGDIFLSYIPDFFNDFDYWNYPSPYEDIDDDNFYDFYDPSIDDSAEEI